MSSPRSFSVPPDVLVAHLQGEAVLLHLDTKRYYRLNDTAAHIWKLLERGANPDAIVESLCREYAVSAADAEGETRRVLADLVQRGLVSAAGEEPAVS